MPKFAKTNSDVIFNTVIIVYKYKFTTCKILWHLWYEKVGICIYSIVILFSYLWVTDYAINICSQVEITNIMFSRNLEANASVFYEKLPKIFDGHRYVDYQFVL